MKSIAKGPICTLPDSGTSVIETLSSRPFSRSFSRTRKAVKGVA